MITVKIFVFFPNLFNERVCVCVCVCVREREREVWYHLGKNKIMLGEKYLSLEIIHNGLFCLFISLFLPFSFFLPFLFLSHLSVPCVCVCVCVWVCVCVCVCLS